MLVALRKLMHIFPEKAIQYCSLQILHRKFKGIHEIGINAFVQIKSQTGKSKLIFNEINSQQFLLAIVGLVASPGHQHRATDFPAAAPPPVGRAIPH